MKLICDYILASYLRNPTSVMPSLLHCSLCFSLPHTHLCAVPHTQTEFISLIAIREGCERKRENAVHDHLQGADTSSEWFYFSYILVKSCSDVMTSLSSYKWSGKGTVQGQAQPRELFTFLLTQKASLRFTDKRNSFPHDFQASVCLCFLHISTETGDTTRLASAKNFHTLHRQKTVCLISFTFRENYIPLEITPLLCFYLRDMRRVIKRKYLSAAIP